MSILAGLRHFQREVFPKTQALFRRFVEGQLVEALCIVCGHTRCGAVKALLEPSGAIRARPEGS